MSPSGEGGWTWSGDANVFVGYNYQDPEFADFTRWESQNWVMGSADQCARARTGAARDDALAGAVHGSRPGFAAVVPDRRELPADPPRQLSASARPADGDRRHLQGSPAPEAGAFIGADLVGAPTLGTDPFMHRQPARDNPQVPLTHHFLDSTHISYGVVRGGVSRASVAIEASAFRGAEPDDHRTNLEQPHLDSWAARVRWATAVPGTRRRPAAICISPSGTNLYDVTVNHRVGRFRRNRGVPAAQRDSGVGWQPRIQWIQRRRRRRRCWNGISGQAAGQRCNGRAEFADKELFGLGVHPKGIFASARV